VFCTKRRSVFRAVRIISTFLKKHLLFANLSAKILFAYVDYMKEVLKQWQNVIFAARMFPSALKCPTPTDVPTEPGNPT
jgi:hypothetical protein